MCNCVVCKNQYEKGSNEIESIRLYEEDSFCSRGYSVYLCRNCFNENITLTEKGCFLLLNNKMYVDNNLGTSWKLINSKQEIDYIFNREYYDVLNKFYKTLDSDM